MKEYIEREAAYQFLKDQLEEETGAYRKGRNAGLRVAMSAVMNNDAIPAADVRPVVLCGVCELHGHCYTEDVFTFARLAEENRFCAVGKVKTNGVKREES